MTKVLSLISTKGGTGKTTIALNLAVAFRAARKAVVVLDLDPQATATAWSDQREDEDELSVLSCQHGRLQAVLQAARDNRADIVIIDTAPHSEAAALAAAKAADLILMPLRPEIFDLRAMANTVEMIGVAKKQPIAVLNAVPVRGPKVQEARSALEELGLETAPVTIGNRAAFGYAAIASQGVTEFEPEGTAATEVKALRKWVAKRLGGPGGAV
ncbi:AAA family ATPase [Rhodocista pekingensis]|uniref:AAA family ATPase n=1 Tax=Rhodocista pekingensis TaxID=201185 RepID=A0ABW2KYR3_9PROT